MDSAVSCGTKIKCIFIFIFYYFWIGLDWTGLDLISSFLLLLIPFSYNYVVHFLLSVSYTS